MNEKWTLRFEKLESWIANNPEGVNEKVIAALIARAKDSNDEHTMRMCWNAILAFGRYLEDWPIYRCLCGYC